MWVRMEQKMKYHLKALISLLTGLILIVIYATVRMISERIESALILFPVASFLISFSIHMELAFRFERYRQEMVVLPTLLGYSPFLIFGIVVLLSAKDDRQISYGLLIILLVILLLILIIKIRKDVKKNENVSKRES